MENKKMNMKIGIFAVGILLLVCVVSVNATTYYVRLDGNDNCNGEYNTGGSSGNCAWRHLSYADSRVYAGDTCYIKGGDYGDDKMIITHTGTESHPIVFEGFDGTPVIDGQDETGNGIYIYGNDYITLRKIHVTKYNYGIYLDQAEYITMDNLDVIYANLGCIFLYKSHHSTIQNCEVTDAEWHNLEVRFSNDVLIENCNSWAYRTDHPTDYHIMLTWASDCIVSNCTARNMHPYVDVHPGHAIGIKDNPDETGTHSHNNTFVDCNIYACYDPLFVTHYAHHNEFVKCNTFRGNLLEKHGNHGIMIRDGAHDNTFENCTADGWKRGISFYDTVESSGIAYPRDNIIQNSIFTNTYDCAINYVHSRDNQIINCVFNTAPTFTYGGDESGGTIKNSIITDISSFGSADPTIAYSDFWNNGFGTPSGTGNIAVNPQFYSSTDYHLKSQYGRWNDGTWVTDATTSPCIDAGDPSDTYWMEPENNGNRINIGAYGNTTQASKAGSSEDTVVGIWHMNENVGMWANDTSTNENNGAITSATWCNGIMGSGLFFNGTTDYVNCGNDASLDVTGTGLTVIGWVKATQPGAYKDIITKSSNAQTNGFALDTGSATTIRFSVGTGTIQLLQLNSSEFTWDGTWKHVAGVYNGSNIVIYVDGSLTNLSSASGSIGTSSSCNLNFGRYPGGGYFYNGSIDEVKIFDYALSATEIYDDFKLNTCPPVPINLQNTTGSYWANYTWSSGTSGGGAETDSYNVSWNETWYNTTLDTYMKKEVGAGKWGNITVYSYNNSGNGNISDGYVSDNVQVTDIPIDEYIPPTPIGLSNTTNGLWANFTWSAGSGNVTDSYAVTINAGAGMAVGAPKYNNPGNPHSWSNISVWAYNQSGNGSFSTFTADDNVFHENNPITISVTQTFSTGETETVSISDTTSSDIDGDTPTYSCNRTDIFSDFNTATGKGNWVTSDGDVGTYYVDLGVCDGYGSTDNATLTITITEYIGGGGGGGWFLPDIPEIPEIPILGEVGEEIMEHPAFDEIPFTWACVLCAVFVLVILYASRSKFGRIRKHKRIL